MCPKKFDTNGEKVHLTFHGKNILVKKLCMTCRSIIKYNTFKTLAGMQGKLKSWFGARNVQTGERKILIEIFIK